MEYVFSLLTLTNPILDLCQGLPWVNNLAILGYIAAMGQILSNPKGTFMDNPSLPVPLARLVLSMMPARPLSRAIEVVTRRMRTRFPKLFKNLSELPRATVYLEPTDLPHHFVLEIGCTPVLFDVLQGGERPADARVTGSLAMLIDMLEGRADGDMLFFSRDIQVTGDTSVIVALRNTLDREDINLFQEITGLCGPFTQPARAAITMADRVACRIKERLGQLHKDLHADEPQGAARDV